MDLYQEALDRLEALIHEAEAAGLTEPTAASLATVGPDGQPRNRVVLVRDRDARGLAFYTNLESLKGRHLADHPHAALCFWYGPLGRQALVEGAVEPVTAAEADDYWGRRPRDHQLGAWASDQSRPVASREALQARFDEVSRRFEGRPVPRPPHWSGFRLVPAAIEFWQFQPSRLHDRERYHRDAGTWVKERLFP